MLAGSNNRAPPSAASTHLVKAGIVPPSRLWAGMLHQRPHGGQAPRDGLGTPPSLTIGAAADESGGQIRPLPSTPQIQGIAIVSLGTLPLSRFTVLDLTHARAGPTAVRQLADWGAKVIKIEPRGDTRDVTGTRRDGFDFQNLHRNKRSLTVNLKTEDGKAVFFKLAEKADVIVENFRSEVKYRLGVDYEQVKKVNPRIVYGSISGFGQSGPYAKRPGVDQIAQGMGGLMSITGLPGQGPVRVGIPIDDLCAGLLLAQAMLMALIERETSGVGLWVQTSLP